MQLLTIPMLLAILIVISALLIWDLLTDPKTHLYGVGVIVLVFVGRSLLYS